MVTKTSPLLSLLVGVALLSTAPSAEGHDGHAGERVVVSGVVPAAAGVSVRSVPGGVGALELRVRGRTRATVLGSTGQPILRVGPSGAEANLAAPEWYRDNEPLGIAAVPEGAGPERPARWKRVSALPAWQWFDHRLHPQGRTVRTWSVPLRVDGQEAQVRGRIEPGAARLELAVDDPEPLPGVSVEAFSAPSLALRVTNASRRPVEIAGPGGETFGRIGPAGAQVNVRSPVWLPTAQYANRDLTEAVLDPRARPRLTLLRRSPALTWVDPRLAPARLPPAPAAGEPAVAARSWRIALRSGNRTAAIAGTTRLAPPEPATDRPVRRPEPVSSRTSGDDGFDWVWLAAALLGVAALTGGYLVGRR